MQSSISSKIKVLDVFCQFLLLGLTSFGGPVAHLGYFQQTFVTRLGWLSQAHYAQLVALSQFLPGPGSSQVGFAIGLHRAGLVGGITAFVAFTLPSFVCMLLLATMGGNFSDQAIYAGAVMGLKLLAIVVVADAVYSMYSNFCTQRQTRSVFVASLVLLLLLSALWLQIAVIFAAAIVGLCWIKPSVSNESASSTKGSVNKWALSVFLCLFAGLPVIAYWSAIASLISEFYLAGSLVFGGGHVVLPLLQQQMPDNIGTDSFLTGYAAAQALPGPMFTFATYLGALSMPHSPVLGAVLATLGVFAPGLLLVLALQGKWRDLADQHRFQGAVAAVNASVVGLLGATLYQPLITTTIHGMRDVALVLLGFLILRYLKPPILLLVTSFVVVGIVFYST